jgi:hypothetical protein
MPLLQVKHVDDGFSYEARVLRIEINDIAHLPALLGDSEKQSNIAKYKIFPLNRQHYVRCTLGVDAMGVEPYREKANNVLMTVLKGKHATFDQREIEGD